MSLQSQGSTSTFREALANDLERGSGDLPVLPEAAQQALVLAQRSMIDYDEVARIAESDPPLAARIMGVANSALYYRGIPIRSIKAAIVRLGVQATRDVLYMAVYSGSVFDVPGFKSEVRRTFKHCITVARFARRLAEVTGLDPETAFLAGLLHDVGRARCLKLAIRRKHLARSKDEILEAVDALHEKAGAQIARVWHLPDEVVEACEHHHDPAGRPMALLVAAADLLAHHLSHGRKVTADEVVAAMEPIGIDEAQIAPLLDWAGKDADTVVNSNFGHGEPG